MVPIVSRVGPERAQRECVRDDSQRREQAEVRGARQESSLEPRRTVSRDERECDSAPERVERPRELRREDEASVRVVLARDVERQHHETIADRERDEYEQRGERTCTREQRGRERDRDIELHLERKRPRDTVDRTVCPREQVVDEQHVRRHVTQQRERRRAEPARIHEQDEHGAREEIERDDPRDAPHEEAPHVAVRVAIILAEGAQADHEPADHEEEVDADEADMEGVERARPRELVERADLDHVVDDHERRRERTKHVDERVAR